MENFFARYKNVLTLALVLLLEFVLLAVQVRPQLPGASVADQAGVRALRLGVHTVVTPPEKVLHASGLGLRGLWSSYVDLVGIKEQNEQLQLENQQLQLEQASLAEDARQGQRLQELLAFRQNYVDSTVPAQVVGASGSDLERILNLDKGSEDGIAPKMPVLTPDGIVGRIREVGPHSSQVLLISDPTSATGVLVEETRTRGVLRGDTVGHPEIVNLIPDDRIKPGQLVLTSGGDQIFPRGLPVGVVDRIVPDVLNQPLVDVLLKPAANLQRLEEVLVVTGTAQAPSTRSRRDLTKSEGAAAAIKAAAAQKAGAAAEAALEAQRASDILAQRLPSASNVENPDAPDAAPGASPATADSASAPLHPPSALHADHYSPGAAPKAGELTPGARIAPLAEGTPDTERAIKTKNGTEGAVPSLSVSPTFRAAHDAAIAARPHAKAAPVDTENAVNPVRSAASATAQPATQASGETLLPKTPRTLSAVKGSVPAGTLVVGPRHAPVPGSSATQARVPGAAGLPPAAGTASSQTAAEKTGAVVAAPRPSTHPPGVQTKVIEDGPLPARKPQMRASGTPPPASGNGPRKRTGPEIVPDDGSRPPTPAPQPTQPAPPQERP